MTKTGMMKENTTQQVNVGCDYGPIVFTVRNNTDPGPLDDYSQNVLIDLNHNT